MKLKNENIRRRANIHKIRKEQRTFKTEKNKDSTSNFWDNCKHEIKSVCSYMNFEKLVSTLHKPVSPRSLGAVRALFGAMMVIDVPDERGLQNIDIKYGDPLKCHFPLFNWLSPLPLEHMGIIYFIMWMGAAGICLGYKFKTSCLMFAIPYWYIFLLDKTVWNNHSYLFGLLSLLFLFSSANHSFSIDSVLDPGLKNKPVPLWNYAILRFQFFLLYFYAGVKKFDHDWIGGHSMTRLSMHWVFDPFKLILSNDQIDFWIIHIFGFLFDLTVGFFLLIEKTRPLAMLFSSAFHLMNSRIFHIGQFPYVCLVTTPIFCSYDWPDNLFKGFLENGDRNEGNVDFDKSKIKKKNLSNEKEIEITWKHKMVVVLLMTYVGAQLFLPYSHFITKGYNNWTNGLYGYSWDMMVHSWDSILVVVKVVDKNSGKEFFLDPEAWVENTRYSRHGDMLVQYAQCLDRNLKNPSVRKSGGPNFDEIEIYIDVWCSLNGRFKQRMFDPRQDLLKVDWSPFKKVSWLMPLLTDLTPWRTKLAELEADVLKWSNYSDVLFVADFPGLYLENYISPDLTNVSLTVLQGTIILEQKMNSSYTNVTLFQGDITKIPSGIFHKVYTISVEPSCYMYTYINRTLELSQNSSSDGLSESTLKKDTLLESLQYRIDNLIDSILILRACFYKLIFNIPIPKRID